MLMDKPTAIVLPNKERNIPYANTVVEKLNHAGIPSVLGAMRDPGNKPEMEKIGYRIRAAMIDNIPDIIIVGDKEETNKSVNRYKPNASKEMPLPECIALIKEAMKEAL
jgi:threonyl-tRNA synthetase